MEIGARHWLVALLIAGGMHAALALTLVQVASPPPALPVTISLTLGDGAGQSAAGGPAVAQSDADGRSEPVSETPDAPASAPMDAADSVPERALEATSEPKAEITPEPAAESELVPESEPEPQPRPRPEPKPEPKPLPQPEDGKPAESERRSQAADTTVKPKVEPSAAISRPSAQATSPAASSVAGAGEGGRGKASGGGRSDARAGAASASAYYGRLARALQKHKRYPEQARRLRQEGRVKVRFTIDRGGRVISQQIVVSSGHALLDREVEAMLRRASPLPAIPASLSKSRLTLTLPIVFNLR
ncbi:MULTISPECIES: energy transducer TonB [Thiorhodovibrio]|uniref:energy transducer TonB n=1 Tax=Thiorhodovibrio TaxID=61593 RepID=UPI001911BEC4|nr:MULTISPECIES: energy transducer TonB [Thiorhodovibrio]MBK5968097.1 hypothetical protein [Thiorhodovibrio winogradskyi]WPL12687.1 transport protein TonB [Thiorhodovibrio litoralis]